MALGSGSEVLNRVAQGGSAQPTEWPSLREELIERLEEIANNEFPIPNLPPPPSTTQRAPESRVSPLPSSPLEASSQGTNKDNLTAEPATGTQGIRRGPLPKQFNDMVVEIKKKLLTFTEYPPHTIQRLAELLLQPRRHYRALASYLHAVDRVTHVTSGTNIYPLPLTVPDMSSMQVNGDDTRDPAASVTWANPTTAALGTDEALGGALLTPIPWLTRRSPEQGTSEARGAQIHSESTETIDGPNGMGSIETVSVRVNGIPSATYARAITQGELLRQEQRAGVVPVTQLARSQERHPGDDLHLDDEEEERPEEDEETPHARGPEEIGVGDTGPQSSTTSHVGEGGLEMQDIDIAAAVGRKHEEDEHKDADSSDDEPHTRRSSSVDSAGSKREADEELQGEHAKRVKENSSEEESSSPQEPVVNTEVPDRTREGKPREDDRDVEMG